MRHDGKRQLILYVASDTVETIRRVAKARKTTMSELVTSAVDEKIARETSEPLVLEAKRRCNACGRMTRTTTAACDHCDRADK